MGSLKVVRVDKRYPTSRACHVKKVEFGLHVERELSVRVQSTESNGVDDSFVDVVSKLDLVVLKRSVRHWALSSVRDKTQLYVSV
jgi:hypothetical protein